MSYSVNLPCGDCQKNKRCTDGIVVRGAVQGIIHSTSFEAGHQGCGSVTLECSNKEL